MVRILTLLAALILPHGALAWQGGGHEPFWSVTLGADQMRITRLGLPDLALAIVAQDSDGDGLRITADDPAHARDAVLTRRSAICHDSMTGMPHPETVSLALGKDWFTGCGGAPVDLLTAQEWQITEINGAPAMAEGPLDLRFDPEGRITGQGGCNRWFAGFDLTGEGLGIGPVGATRMACARPIMDQETRLFAALARVTRFDVTDGGDLVLLAGDTPVIRAISLP
jgi:heat shock protein HslJ